MKELDTCGVLFMRDINSLWSLFMTLCFCEGFDATFAFAFVVDEEDVVRLYVAI